MLKTDLLDNQELLDNEEWQNIQKCWYGIPYIGNILISQIELLKDQPISEEFFDWDKLLLALNFKFQPINKLVGSDYISEDECKLIGLMIYKKFELILDSINKKRQTANNIYNIHQDPYWKSSYTPYQAVTEIERKLKTIKKQKGKDIISLKLWHQIVDDSNIELAEKLAKEISKKEISKKWESVLNLIILLSFAEFSEEEIGEMIESLMNLNLHQILRTALKTACHPKVLESALRYIEKLKEESWLPFLKDALEKEKNNILKQSIMKTMKIVAVSNDTKNIFISALIDIIQSDEEDNSENGSFFFFLREEAILQTRETGTNEDYVDALRSVLVNEKCSPTSKMVAIRMLVEFGVNEGYDEVYNTLTFAIAQKFDRMRYLALQALVSLQDPRSQLVLLYALENTPTTDDLKDYKNVVIKDDDQRTELDIILKGLKALGVEMKQNPGTGKWYKV